MVQKHFPEAIGADDFVQRVEMALHAFGFSGENSIGEWGPRLMRGFPWAGVGTARLILRASKLFNPALVQSLAALDQMHLQSYQTSWLNCFLRSFLWCSHGEPVP